MTEPNSSEQTISSGAETSGSAALPVHVPGAADEPPYAAELNDIELRDRALAFIRRMIRKGAVQGGASQAQYALLAHFDKALRTAILSAGVDGERIRASWRYGMIAFLEELGDDEV